MGQEITSTRFNSTDYNRYEKALERETQHLKSLVADNSFSEIHGVAGFELEICLVDNQMQPVAVNEKVLDYLNDEAVFSPELSKFNLEINSSPINVEGSQFEQFFGELIGNLDHCLEAATAYDSSLLMIGILPTLNDSDLVPDNMSKMQRYRALNDQVMRLRKGHPIELDIHGKEQLKSSHMDVMLEAATTSFQTHLQISQHKIARYYNAFCIASAPLLAIAGNSPFLFGKHLWQETRIPLFEQSVPVGGFDGAIFGPVKRVSFGHGYIRDSITELYMDNLEHYPPLLPFSMDDEIDALSHLRLHNGTIWRWNRPIIGFDDDGTPHFRVEHRSLPAGPTVIDMMANFAFLLGLVTILAERDTPPESVLSFADCRDNFYGAAKSGLGAHVRWHDGKQGKMKDLIPTLIPHAEEGLVMMGLDFMTIQLLLSVIKGRIRNGQTGSVWQAQKAEKLNGDLQEMTHCYQEYQYKGDPVYQWLI